MYNVENLLNPDIIGFIDAIINPIDNPIVVKSVETKKIPDELGNEVKIKYLNYQFLHYSKTNVASKIKGETFLISNEDFPIRKSQFFTPNQKDIQNKFLKTNYLHGAYHPNFTYRPLYNCQPNELYNGFGFKEIIDFLKNITTYSFERSYYQGPGKDDSFNIYQKMEFEKPDNTLFFKHLISLFDIKWFDLNHDPYKLAKSLGEGFYRFISRYDAYSSTGAQWEAVNDKGVTDINKWYEINAQKN